jgi:cobalt-precorrin-7 (C5)-methyltransferase
MLSGLGHLGVEVVPGISSMQYAFSRLRLPLARAVVVDAHGQDRAAAVEEMLDEVSWGRIPFVLTRPDFDVEALARTMTERGVECTIVLCDAKGPASAGPFARQGKPCR